MTGRHGVAGVEEWGSCGGEYSRTIVTVVLLPPSWGAGRIRWDRICKVLRPVPGLSLLLSPLSFFFPSYLLFLLSFFLLPIYLTISNISIFFLIYLQPVKKKKEDLQNPLKYL